MGDTYDGASVSDTNIPPSTLSASTTLSQPRRLSSLSSPTDLSPASPFTPTRLSRSPFSPSPGPSASTHESDDTMSVASSASASNSQKFALPQFWSPLIQACINMPSDEERSLAMGPLIRNEVVRVVGTQIFCYTMKPNRAFCTDISSPAFFDTSGIRVKKSQDM